MPTLTPTVPPNRSSVRMNAEVLETIRIQIVRILTSNSGAPKHHEIAWMVRGNVWLCTWVTKAFI